MSETLVSSSIQDKDSAALREAYSSGTPEANPETDEQKILKQRIKELEAALDDARDKLANLQAGPDQEVPAPITVEAITAPGPDRRDFTPATEIMGSEYADYTDIHNEKMGALTERGRQAIERKWQAEDRREMRRAVRRDERAARRAERRDRRHELRDKAATKLRSWGRAAWRALKNGVTGGREAARNK